MIIKEDKWSNMGCYRVEGMQEPVFNGKVAIEYELQGKAVRYDFFDNFFMHVMNVTNKREPNQTLLDMYLRRVAQLRAKYDYIVLYYSGGADSHNILKCFEHSGTRLDEIVSYEDSSYAGKDSFISSEIYRVAVPTATKFVQDHPETEFRLLNIREVQKQVFADKTAGFDPFYSTTYHMVPFTVMHAFGAHTIKKYHDLHAAGKKVCIIHGIDKPKVRFSNNKWGFWFSDFSSHFGHKHYYNEYPFYDEFFYQTPDDPWITIKQTYVVSRHLDWLDENNFTSNWRLDQPANLLETRQGRKVNWDLVNHVIYPFWDSNTYSSGKQNESFFSSKRDDTNTRYNDEMFVEFKKGLEKNIQMSQARPILLSEVNGSTSSEVVGIKSFKSMMHYIQ